MTREDHVKTMQWFRANHTHFVETDRETGFPAHFILHDGSYFELSTIEECPDFAAVQTLVLSKVAVSA